MGVAQAMKRIPRIKFPKTHLKSHDSGLQQSQGGSKTGGNGDLTFFSTSKASAAVGGKASLQPKRTPVSNKEMEAILDPFPLTFLLQPHLFPLIRFKRSTVSNVTLWMKVLGYWKFFKDRSHSSLRSWRKFRKAAFMLNLFSLRGLSWSGADGQEKVQLTAVELESLRSELADIEEREAHLKARLEHIDEILRSARLSGYLYIRTRWTALPGEPAPVDDTDVDDWLPRFIVLHGQCLFFYLFSTDLSPQDSTLLSDVVEVGSLPSFVREDEGTQYAFYILTRQGLRYECSHVSKVQVDTWLSALQTDCKLGSDVKVPNGS
ncbi:hypothetical protein V6N12_037807 [Hibiscus sabdariffa]|uniref:PH domain-containing protein n=1 Tax=Hibiscus sabdariffa TaxID=183260 RepID=A0ABR2B1X8_9ROSI